MNKNLRQGAYVVAFVAVGAGLGYFFLKPLVEFVATIGTPPPHQTADCKTAIEKGICDDPKHCTVIVPLTACGVMPDVDPPLLHVCEEAWITWKLGTPASGPLSGAKFASDTGIAFKSEDGGADEFSKNKVRDKLFEIHDKYSKKNPPNSPGFSYGIHIVTGDQPNCISFDPRVSNE